MVKRGHLVDFGYLDQHLSGLPEDKPVLRAVWPQPDPDLTEQRMRDLLGRFGLQGEIVEQKVADLSGGERSRAALAKLVVEGANVLVLDEPTNHLDIWACDALEDALREFEGTAIVVSHDRYFLNRVVDLLIVLEPGRCEVVYGNYDTYETLRAAREGADKETRRQVEREKAAREARPANTKPPKRKRKFPYRKVEDLEQAIAAGEAQVAELEAALAAPDLYRDANRWQETLEAFDTAKTELAKLYEHWEEAVELN
jgi:ATP-binding cassette, subfamily F, member 3